MIDVDINALLLAFIVLFSLLFLFKFYQSLKHNPRSVTPTLHSLSIGCVSNFFDTLGIGSFPTSTSYLRLRRLIDDQLIPSTLNIGHAPAAITEALIFITLVPVSPLLLVSTTLSTAVGSFLGSGIVLRLPKRPLQIVLGVASLIAAVLFILVNLHLMPGGGNAYRLSTVPFLLANVTVMTLGALMAAGVGFFGPCLIVLSLLGLHPLAIFPIMMSAGAVQQLTSGWRYLDQQHYDPQLTTGLALGGVAGVLLAAFLVKSLAVDALRWLVAAVALIVAVDFLLSAFKTVPHRAPNASQPH